MIGQNEAVGRMSGEKIQAVDREEVHKDGGLKNGFTAAVRGHGAASQES
jgi:hypothetical protein